MNKRSRGNKRLFVAIMLMLGYTVLFLVRTSFGVTIIPMAEEFKWNEATKGNILSSYFWGYLVLQIYAGVLATKYNTAYIVNIGIFVAALACFFVPLFGKNDIAVIIINIISGLFNSLYTPNTFHLLSKWSPPKERSKLNSIVNCGCPLGLALGELVAGFICDTKWGWRGVYYLFSSVSIIWCIVFYIYIYPTPEEDKRISAEELEYIESSIFATNSPKSPKSDEEERNKENDGIGIEMREINRIASTAIVIDSDDENELAVTPKRNNTSKNNNVINAKILKGKRDNNNDDDEEGIDHSNEKTGLITAEEKSNDYEKEEKKKRKEKNTKKAVKDKKLTRHNSEPIPWFTLFTNRSAIIIYILAGAGDWNFFTLMTYAPTFIKGMYNDLSISTTTILIFFPFLAETVFQLIICPIGDYLIDHKCLSILAQRKVFILVFNVLTALFLVLTCYAPNLSLTIVFLTISTGFSGVPIATYCANMMDISTNSMGMIMALANTVATLSGAVAPLLTSRIIGDNPTMKEWQIVFIISAIVLVVPSAMFICMGRAEIQNKL